MSRRTLARKLILLFALVLLISFDTNANTENEDLPVEAIHLNLENIEQKWEDRHRDPESGFQFEAAPKAKNINTDLDPEDPYAKEDRAREIMLAKEMESPEERVQEKVKQQKQVVQKKSNYNDIPEDNNEVVSGSAPLYQ